MRRAQRKMWWVVPCTSRRSLRTCESRKDVGEILKAKLATIKEETDAEMCEVEKAKQARHRRIANGKKAKAIIPFKAKMGFSFKDSYALFTTRYTSKGSFAGLLQY